MFEVDYERFHTYSSLLEERLKEHAEFILNLNGEKEKIEATERYIKGESDRELF